MNADILKDKISKLPDTSGVYIFRDAVGKIIYIGKAKSLKKRVHSYFSRDLSAKTVALVANVRDIEYRITPTESLALLLEANLIHKHTPKYNIALRDDKSFPFVKITREEFPAVCITRKKDADGARYIGPFTSAKLLRQALRIIRRILPYRSCEKMAEESRMYNRIGLSPLQSKGKINRKDYARTINSIILILEGKTDALVKKLSKEMRVNAREHKFEEAAKARDQIEALSEIGSSHVWGLTPHKDVEELKNTLGLDKLPMRIETFDISNISGKEACGAMVSFYAGSPDKNNYRRFRIKTVLGIDDYGMLSEVLNRRYTRLIRENLTPPDLIIIDGGNGHLMTAARLLKKLKLDIPLIAIAKEQENIYVDARRKPLKFKEGSTGLNLIRRARDEAHRFAISYHRILRRKQIIGK